MILRKVKLLVRVFGVILALMLLAGGGVVIYLKNMDFNTYKPLIKQSVLEATGRNMDIDGVVTLKLSLHPLLVVEGLHLANLAGGSRANMINVERMEVQLSIMPLFDSKLEVDRIVLVAPDILLERLPSGVNNWSFEELSDQTDGAGITEEDVAESDSLLLPQIQRFLIRDAQVIYRDSSAGEDISLTLTELELGQLPNATRFTLRASGAVNSNDFQFSGMIDNLPDLLANRPIQLLEFRAESVGVNASFNGSIAQPLDAQGLTLHIVLETDSMKQVAKAGYIALPRDFPLHLQMTIKDRNDGFQLSKIKARMAENNLAGVLNLNLVGERPAIDGILSSIELDITSFMPVEAKKNDKSVPSESAKTKQSGNQRLFPSESIDFSVLRMADVKLGLQIKRLKLPEFELANLDTQINLANGVLVLNPLSLAIAGGKVDGSLRLASNQAPPHISMKLHLSDIHPSALLAVEKGKEVLIEGAAVNANVTLVGKGKSVAEIMAHANGELLVKLGEGRIHSQAMRLIGGDVLMNLANTLNPFSEKMSYNALQCGVIHFYIKNGEMLSRNGIAFETDRMNVISSGNVNLASEKIDLSISTETREGLGLNVTNMINVVKLGGTLMEPGITADAVKTGMVAARTVGALATGGLSLLGESLFNRVTADASPCQTALKMED